MSHDRQAKLFRVLMHPTRLAILEILRGGEQCVCHLEAVLGQRQAYISQQLMVLREAGLIQDRREGLRVYYRVTDASVYRVLEAARVCTGEGGTAERELAACDCPKCNPAAVAA